MNAHFYDIESLQNVFTLANFKPRENECDIYVLCDDDRLTKDPRFISMATDRIHEKNKNFTGSVRFLNLKREEANRHLARTFGLSDALVVNNPKYRSSYDAYDPSFRLVCDTDPEYAENPDEYPYYMGYNSYNYDTTILAAYLYEVFRLEQTTPGGASVPVFHPVTARLMNLFNEHMFSARFKSCMPDYLGCTQNADGSWSRMDWGNPRWRIRKNMLMSGRHVDVARLNEKAVKVGLKRLIGMLGGQILESDKLKPGQNVIENLDQLCDLIAYNVSDVVNLKLFVFDHPVYQGQFGLKKGLLSTYPELIYEKKPDSYEPNISPYTVRRDRLFVDSSSAQLATKSLCPYGHLTDIPVVSYLYPSERKAAELGIQRVNVLDELKRFFYAKFPQPEIRAEFDKIYKYYKQLEGKNFNQSKNYAEDYESQRANYASLYPNAVFEGEDVAKYSKADTCMTYYNKDGTPSSCFVTFSIGGIHGAEYNKPLYEAHLASYARELDFMQQVQRQFPDPRDLKKAKHVEVTAADGSVRLYPAGKFLKSGSTLKKAEYRDVTAKRPTLFVYDKSGNTKLRKDYVFTSADPTNHEDFTSYYPNLLRMMSAFWNEGLGYDRYAEIFDNKQHYGVLMKPKNANLSPESAEKYRHLREMTGLPLDPLVVSDDERAVYVVQREGTKLILNSASGAADATFESNIRMNNTIISMRVIGQIFSYRIGQAQTYEGAKITSTNTDGLFSVMESTVNDQILARESADIGVEIEPEPTFLISKDTNNRMEIDIDSDQIQAASGGTLACRTWAKKGPSPSKSLAHPAIIDWALAEYLLRAGKTQTDRISLSSDFDDEIGMEIIQQAIHDFEPARMLNLFQNVIASSPGSITYVFATHPDLPAVPRIMQHYNRVFIMKDGTPGTLHLHAACAKKLTPAMINTRKRENLPMTDHDPVALQVLQGNGVGMRDIPSECEATIKKLSGVDEDWYMLVMNKDLSFLSDAEVRDIVDNLDYDKYLTLLRDAFTNSWKNKTPEDDDDPGVDPGVDPASVKQPKPKKPRKSSRKKAAAPDESDEPARDADLSLLNASAQPQPADESANVVETDDPSSFRDVDFPVAQAFFVTTRDANLLPKNAAILLDRQIETRYVDVLVSELRRRLPELNGPRDIVDYILETTSLLESARHVRAAVRPTTRRLDGATTIILD